MIQITEDLVLGARFTLDKAGGVLLRLFEVTGLSPGIDTLARKGIVGRGVLVDFARYREETGAPVDASTRVPIEPAAIDDDDVFGLIDAGRR